MAAVLFIIILIQTPCFRRCRQGSAFSAVSQAEDMLRASSPRSSKQEHSSLGNSIVLVVDLGGAEDVAKISVPKAKIRSLACLRKEIARACVHQVGRECTPKQWLTQTSKDIPMSISLLFDDDGDDAPTQYRLTSKVDIGSVFEATSVHVMPT